MAPFFSIALCGRHRQKCQQVSHQEVELRKEKLRLILGREEDVKMRIWLRVRLAQEGMIDAERELGYPNVEAVSVMLKRWENEFETEAEMKRENCIVKICSSEEDVDCRALTPFMLFYRGETGHS